MEIKNMVEKTAAQIIAKFQPSAYNFSAETSRLYSKKLCKELSANAYAAFNGKIPAGAISYKILEWDSKHFGFPYADIGHAFGDISSLMPLFNEWIKAGKVRFCSAKVEEKDCKTAFLLESEGFNIVETAVTFFCPLKKSAGAEYSLAKKEDIEPIGKIAYESFINDRFSIDKKFDAAAVRERKRKWAINSCNGYSDAVLAVREGGRTAGFIACKIENDLGIGRIHLVAVDGMYRGKGYGKLLVEQAKRYFSENGLKYICVSTQEINNASIALYQKTGFKLSHRQIVLHKWWY